MYNVKTLINTGPMQYNPEGKITCDFIITNKASVHRSIRLKLRLQTI